MPNIPAAGHWRLLYLPYFAATEGWAAQIAVGAVENSGLCWRKARGPEWQAWEFAATTTPPQEFDLPLAEGWEGNVNHKYLKTQEGIVIINSEFLLSDGASVTSGSTIATMPQGFRPQRWTVFPAVVQDLGERYAASVQIGSTGSVIYNGRSNSSTTFRIFLNAVFLAAD